SQHELAIAYRRNGQTGEAIALLERVVKIWEPILTHYHPSRLLSQRDLADLYKANGQVEEAAALMAKIPEVTPDNLDGSLA
ncbi:hypothetical protein CI102_8668, partial [Trichoderma harzianum]